MKVPTNKIKDIKTYYSSLLAEKFSQEETKYYLNVLLEEYSDYSKHEIFLYPEKPLSESELLKVHFAVKDLLLDKPIQYIIGKVHFMDVELLVNESVLIPRPETEELVDLICKNFVDRREETLQILDIGTGSGAIAISLKKYFENAEVTALDISENALAIAKENAKQNNTPINFLQKNILEEVFDTFESYDLIVSNPPYVRELEKGGVKPNVLEFEPQLALFVADKKPLVFYEKIAELSKTILKENGSIFLEINQYLSKETEVLFAFFPKHELRKDFRGNYRFLHINSFS